MTTGQSRSDDADRHRDATAPSSGGGTNWRLWILGIAVLLVLIIALQNSQEVEMDFLFVSTTAPLIAALLLATGLGVVIGYIAPVLRRHSVTTKRRGED